MSSQITIYRPEGLTNTTNLAWRYTKIERSPEETEIFKIFSMMFAKAKGFVKIGQYNNHEFYPPEALQDPYKVSAIIGSRKYKRNNAVFSVCTYRDKTSGSQNNVLSINAVCIDVDYHTSRNQDIAELSADTAVKKFCQFYLYGNLIPEPTYIEVSHNFRLVYVLDAPFVVPKGKKTREGIFTLFRRIQQVISETITSYEDWGVDTQYKVAPYVRIPESKNIRWNPTTTFQQVTQNRKCYEVQYSEEVHIYKASSWQSWDFDELTEVVLPPKPEWYDSWKEKQAKKSRKKEPLQLRYTTYNLFQDRMHDLEKLQTLGWDVGYREKMVFLYRLSALQSGMTSEEALEAALEFNSAFATPLLPHDVEVRCKPSNPNLKYRNSTIRRELDLDDRMHPLLFQSSSETQSQRYQRRKEEKIQSGVLVTKQQRLEETYQQIIALKGEGKKQKEIEEILTIPHRTMTRYVKTLKDRNLWNF